MKRVIKSLILVLLTFCGPRFASAETLVRIKVGGFRTIEPTRSYDRITNRNPETIEVIEDTGNRSFQIKGIAPGEGIVDLIGTSASGNPNTRSFRVLVRPSEDPQPKAASEASAPSGDSLSSWFKREFKNLRSQTVGEKVLLTGSLSSTQEFQKLEQMATKTSGSFIPNYTLSPGLLEDLITMINSRMSRSKNAQATLVQNGNSIVLITDKKKDESIQNLIQRYSEILPGFDSTMSGNPDPDAQIKVTMHFVESIEIASDEVSQKFSGGHFPLTGELSLQGIEQAPFSFYLKYLNSQMSTRLLEQPAIVTQSGRSAELHSGGDLAYQAALSSRASSTQFRNFGLTAQVLPTTRIDGSIAMDLDLEISEPSGGSAGSEAQTLTKRRVKSALTLDDGMAKLVARLRRQKKETSKAAPPILESIPVVSWLVTSKGRVSDTADLWIFVSATSSLYQDFGDSQQELDRVLGEH